MILPVADDLTVCGASGECHNVSQRFLVSQLIFSQSLLEVPDMYLFIINRVAPSA